MGSLTEFTVGAMRFKIDSEQSSIASMTEQITRADANLAVRRQRYEAQFAQMEKIIKNLNSQGSFLNGQIASFQKSSG
jgi:flagellar capping protein FliD